MYLERDQNWESGSRYTVGHMIRALDMCFVQLHRYFQESHCCPGRLLQYAGAVRQRVMFRVRYQGGSSAHLKGGGASALRLLGKRLHENGTRALVVF